MDQVAAYHERCLAALQNHVAEAIDRCHAGEIDVFAVDETIHQYHQAARKLWVFCWANGSATVTAAIITDMDESDPGTLWWERAGPRRSR